MKIFVPLETIARNEAKSSLTGFTPLKALIPKRAKTPLMGFTLVETLIALLVLGLGLVLVFNLFPLGWQALSYSRKLNEVSYLAQRKFEELKTAQKIHTGSDSGTDGDLRWEITVKPVSLGPGLGLNWVELNIQFDFLKKTQTQKFITYIAEKSK
jgi:hypothetical protein